MGWLTFLMAIGLLMALKACGLISHLSSTWRQ